MRRPSCWRPGPRCSRPSLPAQARALPVDYDFALGALAGFAHPQTPPPGADNGCRPSAAHPEPVILVNGTFANQDDNWQAASPLLANHGYCVFTFNYGGPSASSIVQGTGDIATSAGQLGTFVTQVLASTGAGKVGPGGAFAGWHDAAVLPEVRWAAPRTWTSWSRWRRATTAPPWAG